MHVTSTPEGKSSVRLQITLPADAVAAAISTAVQHVAQHVRIPGFRPGKAPRAMVERIAGRDRVLDEATEVLVERGYREAVRERGIIPLASPTLDAKTLVEGAAYTFSAVVPIPPEVRLGDYRTFPFAPKFEAPDEAKVDAVVEDLRDSYATLTVVANRSAELGDYAIIAFTGYRADTGAAIDGASSERMPIVLGSERLIPGFEAQLVGAKVGDAVTVNVTFPDDYTEAALQGVAARFEVEVQDLRARVKPPLDDAFAQQVANVTDVAGLHAEVFVRLQASAVERGRHEFADRIVEYAMANATVEIPDPLIDEEVDGLVDELARSIARQGLTFEQYLTAVGKSANEIRAEFRDRGEKRARTLLVLSAVAGAESVEVPEALVDEEVERAKPQVKGQKKMEAYLTSERGRRAIRASLRRSLVVERLVDEWLDTHPDAWPTWAPERPASSAVSATGQGVASAAAAKPKRGRTK